jgi:hypothetical protein
MLAILSSVAFDRGAAAEGAEFVGEGWAKALAQRVQTTRICHFRLIVINLSAAILVGNKIRLERIGERGRLVRFVREIVLKPSRLASVDDASALLDPQLRLVRTSLRIRVTAIPPEICNWEPNQAMVGIFDVADATRFIPALPLCGD